MLRNNVSATSISSTSSDLSDLSDHVKGPGLFYVRSRVAPAAKDIFSKAKFMEWYEEHAEEVVAKSGIHSLFRYNATGETSASNASKPFLTFPVMEDIGFLLSEEFKSVSTASPILPGSGKVYDLIEFDVNFMALRQDTVSEKGHSKPAKTIVTIEIQPPTGLEADEINAFFSKQVRALDEQSGYTRSLMLESCFCFASAGGKKPEAGASEKQHELPSWVVIHMFSGAVGDDLVKQIELDLHKMNESIGNMQEEVRVWSLQKVFGEERLL